MNAENNRATSRFAPINSNVDAGLTSADRRWQNGTSPVGVVYQHAFTAGVQAANHLGASQSPATLDVVIQIHMGESIYA